MKKNDTKYSIGCLVVFIFAVLCAAMIFQPLYGSEHGSAIFRILLAKNIYSVACAALAVFPLLIIITTLLLPLDVIKKYVIVCFMSLWLLAGFAVLAVLLKSKYPGLGYGYGTWLSLCFGVALLASTIISTVKDKSSRSHKEIVWYNGFNKIILLISLPALVCLTVVFIMFYNMIFSFPAFVVAGIISAWLCFGICSLVSVTALFAKYKFGILHYLTAFLSVIAVMGILITSTPILMLAGLVVSVLLALFWMFLGSIAKKNFF